MIKLASFHFHKINKFKKWLIKTKKLKKIKGDFNFLFCLFFILKPYDINKPFDFINLKTFYEKNEELWDGIFNAFLIQYKNENTSYNIINHEIFNNLNENKNHIDLDLLINFVQSKQLFFMKYYEMFKLRFQEINETIFKNFYIAFILNYALFFKHDLIWKNNNSAKKIALRLYLENIYTYNMQLIFQTNFNDFYIIVNKLLPCHF